MLNSGKPADSPLIAYLEAGKGRTGPRGKSLSQVLAARGTTDRTLVSHIDAMQSHVVARKPEPPSPDRLIRLQDRGPEPVVVVAPAPQKPGFFRRIGMLLGF
jgi:hypothetical protein